VFRLPHRAPLGKDAGATQGITNDSSDSTTFWIGFKAFHYRIERVGLQESSPQNNFRRIIACRIPKGNFCNHTINYTTKDDCEIDLALALFVLNSSFADWYFRLGSTNAHVSHYQLTNLPCPRFGNWAGDVDNDCCKKIDSSIEAKNFQLIEKECLTLAANKGCTPTLGHIIVRLVKFIEKEERHRGEIARTERSHLAEDAEKCQVVLDKLMLALLGIGQGSGTPFFTSIFP
jgi:hypothetical protein